MTQNNFLLLLFTLLMVTTSSYSAGLPEKKVGRRSHNLSINTQLPINVSPLLASTRLAPRHPPRTAWTPSPRMLPHSSRTVTRHHSIVAEETSRASTPEDISSIDTKTSRPDTPRPTDLIPQRQLPTSRATISLIPRDA